MFSLFSAYNFNDAIASGCWWLLIVSHNTQKHSQDPLSHIIVSAVSCSTPRMFQPSIALDANGKHPQMNRMGARPMFTIPISQGHSSGPMMICETMWNLPILLIPGANMHQPTLLLVGQMVIAGWNNLEISDEQSGNMMNMYQISCCFLLTSRAWQGLHPSDWWEVSAPCYGVVPAAKHLETWLMDQLNQPNQAKPEHVSFW